MTWSLNEAVKINLVEEDDFLKIAESLTRMGSADNDNKVLTQLCHILHKQGDYYIIHHNALKVLDGDLDDLEMEDWLKQNRIAQILADWELCDIVTPIFDENKAKASSIKIIKYGDKKDWTLAKVYDL